jgi:hypothetical protein
VASGQGTLFGCCNKVTTNTPLLLVCNNATYGLRFESVVCKLSYVRLSLFYSDDILNKLL